MNFDFPISSAWSATISDIGSETSCGVQNPPAFFHGNGLANGLPPVCIRFKTDSKPMKNPELC
jgi:hypothetical protein